MDRPDLTCNLRVLNTFEKKILKPTQTGLIMKDLMLLHVFRFQKERKASNLRIKKKIAIHKNKIPWCIHTWDTSIWINSLIVYPPSYEIKTNKQIF